MALLRAIPLLAALVVSCQAAVARLNTLECSDPEVSSGVVSLFPEDERSRVTLGAPTSEISTAQDFTVEYFSNYKVVKNLFTDSTYVLTQCGTAPPPASEFPDDAKFFDIPLHSVTIMDTTILGYMDLLDVEDRIAVNPSTFATDACIQKHVKVCGGFTSANITMTDADKEHTDAIFGFFHSEFVDPENPPPPPSDIAIDFTATVDEGMLNRLEWIKFAAVFFNMEAQANLIHATIESEFEEAQVEQRTQPRKVAFVSTFGGGTHTIDGTSAYKQELAALAGGELLGDPAEKNNYDYTNAEELQAFHAVLKQADVIIDESYPQVPYVDTYTAADFEKRYNITAPENVPAIGASKVFSTDGLVNSGGTDWFQGFVVRAHEALRDFASALTPPGQEEPHDRIWLRSLYDDEEPSRVLPEDCEVEEAQLCAARSQNSFRLACPRVVQCDGEIVVRNQDTTACDQVCEIEAEADADSEAEASPDSASGLHHTAAVLAAGLAALAMLLI